MIIKKYALFAALGLGVLSTAQAGLFDDDQARKRIIELQQQQAAHQQKTDERLKALEDSLRAQLQLQNQLQAIQQENAQLRGQIEVLTYGLEQAQKRQKDFYVDLDTRLRKLEEATIRQTEAQTAAAAKASAETENRDYENALNMVKAGDYRHAAEAFKTFTETYPNSSFSASANFWYASALFQSKQPAAAAPIYAKVVNTWPDDTRAPDALLGLANCQTAAKDTKAARKTLESLVTRYPASSAAQIAKQRLARK